MASFCFLLLVSVIIMASLVSLCCSSDHHHHHHHSLKLDIIPSTLSSPIPVPAAAPAPAADPSFTELSPDVAPPLPSSGGVVPSPTSSSSHHVPTIPSNPSPPKPEDDVPVGPDSAFAPFGSSLAASSALNLTPMGSSRILNVFSCMTYAIGMFIIFSTANCILQVVQ